jgi:hypothetical protein
VFWPASPRLPVADGGAIHPKEPPHIRLAEAGLDASVLQRLEFCAEAIAASSSSMANLGVLLRGALLAVSVFASCLTRAVARPTMHSDGHLQDAGGVGAVGRLTRLSLSSLPVTWAWPTRAGIRPKESKR